MDPDYRQDMHDHERKLQQMEIEASTDKVKFSLTTIKDAIMSVFGYSTPKESTNALTSAQPNVQTTLQPNLPTN